MPQIKLSELRAGLASGKITDADVTKLKSAGYQVFDDESKAAAAPSSPAPAEPSMIRKVGNAIVDNTKEGLRNVGQAYVGAGKGVIDTGYNLAKMATHNPLTGTSPLENPDLEEGLKGENLPQKIGKFVERGAEFAAGEGAANALAKGTGFLA